MQRNTNVEKILTLAGSTSNLIIAYHQHRYCVSFGTVRLICKTKNSLSPYSLLYQADFFFFYFGGGDET